jgi:hypothetical protein
MTIIHTAVGETIHMTTRREEGTTLMVEGTIRMAEGTTRREAGTIRMVVATTLMAEIIRICYEQGFLPKGAMNGVI